MPRAEGARAPHGMEVPPGDRIADDGYARSVQRRRRHLVVGALAMLVASFGPLASPLSPARAADPVLVGAGDIADCATGADSATATLLDAIPGTVVTLGDNAYPSGTSAQF